MGRYVLGIREERRFGMGKDAPENLVPKLRRRGAFAVIQLYNRKANVIELVLDQVKSVTGPDSRMASYALAVTRHVTVDAPV